MNDLYQPFEHYFEATETESALGVTVYIETFFSIGVRYAMAVEIIEHAAKVRGAIFKRLGPQVVAKINGDGNITYDVQHDKETKEQADDCVREVRDGQG